MWYWPRSNGRYGANYPHGTVTTALNSFAHRHPLVRNYRRLMNRFMHGRKIDFDRQFRGMTACR